jgi:hypothetical protein
MVFFMEEEAVSGATNVRVARGSRPMILIFGIES